jgi:hypothetical protein
MRLRQLCVKVAGLAAITTAALSAEQVTPGTAPGTFTGPQSSHTPFVVPTSEGWAATSLLTVGDAAADGGNPMAGIPDGLGAIGGRPWHFGLYVNERDYMTVFMNHELPVGTGGVRAHGQPGAFVSQWTIRLDTLEVVSGEDLIRDVYLWSGTDHFLGNGLPESQFGRLCSADLPDARAFFNPRTFRGFFGRLYLSGEETGNEGRGFAHVVTGPQKGSSYQLPYLGRMSWENAVAHPDLRDQTLVMNLDDSTPGQVYLYLGTKRRFGNPVQRAGLEGGSLFGIKVVDGGPNYGDGAVPFESNGALHGRFALEDVSDVATGTGAVLQSTSRTRGVTEFARPEDGAWDTKNDNIFYFVTTGASVATPPGPAQTQTARLYRLVFDDIHRPTKGGRIELVVDSATLTGKDGQTARSFDNMTMDGSGRAVVQEDPGNSGYIAKTWRINPFNGEAEQILESDRSRFVAGQPGFLTQDEESSGIIEITDLVRHAKWFQRGHRYYLADMQAHRSLPAPSVEDGQLYLIRSRRLQ